MNTPQDLDLSTFLHKVIENNSTTTIILVMLGAAVWLIESSGSVLDLTPHYGQFSEKQVRRLQVKQ